MTKNRIEEAFSDSVSTERALDLALEALEIAAGNGPHDYPKYSEALTAIKQARSATVQPIIGSYLEKDNSQFKFSDYESDGVHHNKPAQPAPVVQEPVAYAVYHRMGGSKTLHWPEQHSENGDAKEYKLVPLYTTPPAAQQDIQRLSALVRAQQITIDKLEAAQPEPVQEPVADAMARYLRVCSSGGMPKKLRESVQNLVYDAARLGYFKAATPPAAQRQWVYLTELEKAELWNRDTPIAFSYADAIEAKLKAKNFA